MLPGFASRRRFSDLSEQEVLALAISSEEDDARIYRQYAEHLRKDFPASAGIGDFTLPRLDFPSTGSPVVTQGCNDLTQSCAGN